MTQEQPPHSPGGSGPGPEEGAQLEHSIDLVHKAQGGDLDAYDRLFARYYLRVLQIVRARLGPRLRRELESQDVAQEAMVEAIRNFPRFRIESRAALLALFAAIVENRMRANARRIEAQMRDRDCEVTLGHVRESLSSGTIALDPADDELPPPELVAQAERKLLIDACIEALDERDRRVIRLRDYEGLGWDEIAARIGSPTASAARMTHARALIRLKTELDRLGALGDGV